VTVSNVVFSAIMYLFGYHASIKAVSVDLLEAGCFEMWRGMAAFDPTMFLANAGLGRKIHELVSQVGLH
jgi:hypothetical protein